MAMDETAFINKLPTLTEADFGTLRLHFPECHSQVDADGAVSRRVSQLVNWARSATGPGTPALADACRQLWGDEFVPRAAQGAPAGEHDPIETSVPVADKGLPDPKHVVLLVHGIRDVSGWQERAADLLKKRGLHAIPVTFGYYDVVSFLSPVNPGNAAYATFLQQFARAREQHPQAIVSIVAHSFGTFLVGRLLKEHPQPRVGRIILCGSVLPEDFDWSEYVDRYGVDVDTRPAVLNECGSADKWPVYAQIGSRRYGAAGRYGFQQYADLAQRWFDGGHSLFLKRAHMDNVWGLFLTDATLPTGTATRPPPSWWERILHTLPGSRTALRWLTFVPLWLLLRFWWAALLIVLAGVAVTALPTISVSRVSRHNEQVSGGRQAYLTIQIDRNVPESIGPTHLRMLNSLEHQRWEAEWDTDKGPYSNETILLPDWGTYLITCWVGLTGKPVRPQRSGSLAPRIGEPPDVSVRRYRKEFEIDSEDTIVNLSDDADRIIPPLSAGGT